MPSVRCDTISACQDNHKVMLHIPASTPGSTDISRVARASTAARIKACCIGRRSTAKKGVESERTGFAYVFHVIAPTTDGMREASTDIEKEPTALKAIPTTRLIPTSILAVNDNAEHANANE